MSMSLDGERGLIDSVSDCAADVWNSRRSWRDSCVEGRLSAAHVNHVDASSWSLVADSDRGAVQQRRRAVDRSKRLTSFSVADILGPRYGSSSHHHQQQQQHDDVSDDVESTSSRSNDDLSSSVLSHTSSTDGPSPTGSDREHSWTETDPQHSTSRKFFCYHFFRCCITSSSVVWSVQN